jgi:hypothetical protein
MNWQNLTAVPYVTKSGLGTHLSQVDALMRA